MTEMGILGIDVEQFAEFMGNVHKALAILDAAGNTTDRELLVPPSRYVRESTLSLGHTTICGIKTVPGHNNCHEVHARNPLTGILSAMRVEVPPVPCAPAGLPHTAMAAKLRAYCERKGSAYFKRGDVTRIMGCTAKEAAAHIKWLLNERLGVRLKGKWYQLMPKSIPNPFLGNSTSNRVHGGNVFSTGIDRAQGVPRDQLLQMALAAKHAGMPLSDDRYNAVQLAAGGVISRKSAMAQCGIDSDAELRRMADERESTRLEGRP